MKSSLKWVLWIIGSLMILVIFAGLCLYGLGQYRLNRTYTINPTLVKVPAVLDDITEGKRIFQYRGCEACHGENLEGLVYLSNPAIGQVVTPNLTSGEGGIGEERTDFDLVKAIRYGVKPDSKPMLFMPSTEFYYLSEKDLGLILAYFHSRPPIDNQPEASQLSVTGFIAMNLTREITFIPAELINQQEPPPPAPKPGISEEFGQYLSLSCPVCHGLNMSGGEIPGFPPEWPAAGNLTTGSGSRLTSWGKEGFIEIITKGEKHGRGLHPDYMPWTSYRHMNEMELQAVYQYLISLPPRDFGSY